MTSSADKRLSVPLRETLCSHWLIVVSFCHSAIRWRRNLRQPASVRAEKHHHRVPVLWRERHLPTRHLHQHPRAALHQHKHPVHPHQPVPRLQSALPSGSNGRRLLESPPLLTWRKQAPPDNLSGLRWHVRDKRICLLSGYEGHV